MNITYRQKANLFHMLVLFPLIFLAINDDLIKDAHPEVLKKIVSVIIVAGIFYHLYLFMYVNSVTSA